MKTSNGLFPFFLIMLSVVTGSCIFQESSMATYKYRAVNRSNGNISIIIYKEGAAHSINPLKPGESWVLAEDRGMYKSKDSECDDPARVLWMGSDNDSIEIVYANSDTVTYYATDGSSCDTKQIICPNNYELMINDEFYCEYRFSITE